MILCENMADSLSMNIPCYLCFSPLPFPRPKEWSGSGNEGVEKGKNPCQYRTQSPQALWPAVGCQPLVKETEGSGYARALTGLKNVCACAKCHDNNRHSGKMSAHARHL